MQFTVRQRDQLVALLEALIDQESARVIVSPYQNAPGFWFGGGSLVQDENGAIGLKVGERGLECALFCSKDGGETFRRVRSWSKADLSRPGREVLSIEGTALHRRRDGQWELYVSSEKAISYPPAIKSYQKPGTGVWTIDVITGPTPDELDVRTLTSVLENAERPEYLHVKDPVVFDLAGKTHMVFCSHPFSWSSSNTGLATRTWGEERFEVARWEMVPRGATWDVAAMRITDRLPVPPVGVFAGQPSCSIYFYDGAECLRSHEENPLAHKRPRGFSCEELGGAFCGWDDAMPRVERLSILEPLFVSPWGTGASRYVATLATERGILATWEQSQPDGSQPLVGHWLDTSEIGRILSGRD